MSKPEAVAAILWIGVTLYAVFGGADFGAGVWSLLSRRDGAAGTRARARIERSLGPVWEANHVWLIFCLVVLWTGFPGAFGPLMETLYIPLALAAIGIVLRGAGFAFGHTFSGAGKRRSEEVFAASSVITPFFMGCVVGAVAAGEVPAAGGGEPLSSWLQPLSLLVGVLFVASGTYVAAVFLTDDARRAGQADLVSYFRRRAIVAAVLAGGVAIAGLFVLRADARPIFDGLVDEGLPLVAVSVLAGGLALVGLSRGGRRWLRPLAVLAVVGVIWGWGVAQHPFLLPGSLTIEEAAGASETLTALIVVFGFALLVVGPALAFLYRLSQRQVLE